MNLTKLDATKDFIFCTLLSKEAQDSILDYWLTCYYEKIHVSRTRDMEAIAPSELPINTTFVANNLPKRRFKHQLSWLSRTSLGTKTLSVSILEAMSTTWRTRNQSDASTMLSTSNGYTTRIDNQDESRFHASQKNL